MRARVTVSGLMISMLSASDNSTRRRSVSGSWENVLFPAPLIPPTSMNHGAARVVILLLHSRRLRPVHSRRLRPVDSLAERRQELTWELGVLHPAGRLGPAIQGATPDRRGHELNNRGRALTTGDLLADANLSTDLLRTDGGGLLAHGGGLLAHGGGLLAHGGGLLAHDFHRHRF